MIEDLRWALNMLRARRWRRGLTFSRRRAFDDALRPGVEGRVVIAYPDAFYHVTIEDVGRALIASTRVS